MDELVSFLEDLLSATPPQGLRKSAHREHMTSRLNQTRELLAEIALKQTSHGVLWLHSLLY